MRDFVITSESVTAGHPDKLCDRISDAVVDAWLAAGSRRGVIAECAIATGVAFLSIRSADDAPVDAAALARRVMAEVGYGAALKGDGPTVILDLASGPDAAGGEGGRARHMTTAFGYACEGSASRLPFPIEAAHRLTRALDAARREGRAPWLSPDAQAQVAVEFRDRRPAALRAVALTMGAIRPPGGTELREALLREVVTPAFEGARLALDEATRFVVEPAPGEGGPAAHSGLTGRKTADDAYGAFARRGGAALSGKDPSRIDRIAAYAARHAARAAVDAGLAGELEVQLSYVIGDEAPASVEVDSFGSGRLPDERLSRLLREAADLRVAAVAERMDLWNLPGLRDGRFYRDLAAYGHMGRDDLAAPWEDTADLAARLG